MQERALGQAVGLHVGIWMATEALGTVGRARRPHQNSGAWWAGGLKCLGPMTEGALVLMGALGPPWS